MNIYQRIVLIVGALALLVLGVNIRNLIYEYAVYFILPFLGGMLTIRGITLLLFFALKGIGEEK
jgi:hypothetical protein